MDLLLPLDFPRPVPIENAVEALAAEGSIEQRGAVYTSEAVVREVLDLCQYQEENKLFNLMLLEPSFGKGDFLIPVVERLLNSIEASEVPKEAWHVVLKKCIFAIELHKETFEKTKRLVIERLKSRDMAAEHADALASSWLKQDDFLLTDLDTYDVIVGNPPYVRQERIPQVLLNEYKRHFKTLYDRADLYIPFYEKSLKALKPGGVLGFICANRWVKNKFGGPLRKMIAASFHLERYANLESVKAFKEKVDAYASITVIRNGSGRSTTVYTTTKDLRLKPMRAVTGLMNGSDPWLLESPEIIEVLRGLENNFPTLEHAGVKVGIGVATGNDKVFIGEFSSLPVEGERKLPLILASDLKDGCDIQWRGRGIVNPWLRDGGLARFEAFPLFGNYLSQHEEALRKRHTAKKTPDKWYKTIDRIYPDLVSKPKLLVPDIKGEATFVFDEGRFYPHHNLYVITSETWDLRSLQTVLRSSLALMFIGAYSVKMSGGFLRFQAQYLRRIRLPKWSALSDELKRDLKFSATSKDQREIDDLVAKVYGLSSGEKQTISRFASTTRIVKRG